MKRFGPLLIVCYFIVGVLLYAAATPIFESPDEASHFLYAHNLHNTGQLPILEDRATVFASGSVQRHHPPLYYLLGSLLLTGTERTDLHAYLRNNPFAVYGTIAANNAHVLLHPLSPPPGDTMAAAWRLRLLSLVFACGTLICVYRVGRMAFGRRVGLLAMLLAASIPSFVSISGSINNDNAVTFFYSAGIAWAVWVWQKRTLTSRDALLLGAILAGAALSKITGLTLIGFIGLVLVAGVVRGRFVTDARKSKAAIVPSAWRGVLQTIVMAGAVMGLLAGWWYVRNGQLYGDALALAATNAIWGRAAPHAAQFASEMGGVWESFWLILGHFNVRGPDWFYSFVTLVSVLGGIGLLLPFTHRFVGAQRAAPFDEPYSRAQHAAPLQRSYLLILGAALLIVIAALVIATRSVNVSQGRILFPALAAFAPLLIVGWQTLIARLLPARLGAGLLLPLLPLLTMHLLTPFTLLAPAFATPRPLTALPAEATRLEADAEGLRLIGYHLAPTTMTPDDALRVRLYLTGRHLGEPALFVKIIDPLSLVPIGGLDVYPGMTPMSQLDPSQLYEFAFTIPIDRTRLTGRTPRRLDVFVGVRHVTSADPDPRNDDVIPIPWVTADGTTVDILQFPAATLVDPDYVPPTPAQKIDVIYGKALKLVGATITSQTVPVGGSFSVSLVWEGVRPMAEDWTLALGVIDSAGRVIAQADGPIPGYPTSAWRTGTLTEDTRTLTLSADVEAGDLRLFIGWYRPTDANQRLTAQGAGVDNDLFISAPIITVTP